MEITKKVIMDCYFDLEDTNLVSQQKVMVIQAKLKELGIVDVEELNPRMYTKELTHVNIEELKQRLVELSNTDYD